MPSDKKTTFNRVPNHKELSKFCLKYWEDLQIYTRWQRAEKPFILHDGPPYANGNIHIGHALNKILKDCVNRFMAMLGYRPHFIMGWDCNGLPIETKVEAKFANEFGLKMSQIKESKNHISSFREECAQFAKHWIEVQKQSFKELGVIADSTIFTTIDPKNQISIIELIHEFAKADLIYRGLKPVMWSCEEGTALAEAEIEYMNKKSQTIDVGFNIIRTSSKLIVELVAKKPVIIPIWTTTPWTIPENRAVAYNKNINYVIAESDKAYFVVAESLIEDFAKRTQLDFINFKNCEISELAGIICAHPILLKVESPLLHSDHVTAEQGTGFVHICPDHGVDDFKLCRENHISCSNYINDAGHFIEDLPEGLSSLSGKFYAKAESDIINKLMENQNLLSYHQIEHQYPHSWRSKKPLIYRATNQWFIKIKDLQQECLQEVDKVQWIPKSSKDRFKSILRSRSEWCISRHRLWGTPIAFFYEKTTGKVLIDDDILKATCDSLLRNGINYWWTEECANELLGPKRSKDYLPVRDIVDVWFESGTSQRFLLQALDKYPADMYLEGSDQHRGWFQSSMINGYFEKHQAPFKCIKTHGFLVDKLGKKMSKSSGNGLSPSEIIEKYGADVLRLGFLRQSCDNDLNWSESQIKEVETMYLKIRNTIKFLLQHAQKTSNINYEGLPALESWALHQVFLIQELINNLPNGLKQMEAWDIHVVVHKIYQLCDISLSKLYFDIRKDVLYWESGSSVLKEQVKNTLWIILSHLLRWLAPITPFTAEEAWQICVDVNGDDVKSIHLEKFEQNLDQIKNTESFELVENLLKVRKLLNTKIEPFRANGTIKTTLDAKVIITCKHNSILFNPDTSTLLKNIVLISDLEIKESQDKSQGNILEDLSLIEVVPSEGYKCIKCKRRVSQLKEELCLRCSINKNDL